MCEQPSPARSNNPAPAEAGGPLPHAGFAGASPQGVGTASDGPTLSGWPRRVTWQAFRQRSKRPAGHNEDAQIAVELRPGRLRMVREAGQFRIGRSTLRVRINARRSWVVTSRRSNALLAHEQGHFDLTGLCYRDLVAAIKSARRNSRSALVAEVRRLLREYDQRSDRLSVDYDAATRHGLDSDKQTAWEASIRAAIDNRTTFKRPG